MNGGKKRGSLSRIKMVEKSMLKKNGRKCKQRELKAGGEMEVNEGEVLWWLVV